MTDVGEGFYHVEGHYIFDGHRPVPEHDLFTWARWYERAERHVADDTIGGMRVSTVFLGLDHRFMHHGPPILFETMVFDADGEGVETERYSTWDEAERGHQAMCAMVRALHAIPEDGHA